MTNSTLRSPTTRPVCGKGAREPLAGRRVLCVEDDPASYEVIFGILSRYGWVVERACNPVEAMEKLAAASPANYDVILIDRMLDKKEADPDSWRDDWGGDPRRAGDELLKRVAVQHPYVCPVILTNLDDYAAAQVATNNGAHDYIVKGDRGGAPTFAENLDRRLRGARQGHRVRRLRHRLLAKKTFDGLLEVIFLHLRDELTSHTLNLFYLQEEPGGALVAIPDKNNPLPLQLPGRAYGRGLEDDRFLLEPFETARFVLETRLNSYRDDAGQLHGTSLTAKAGLQLLAPVLVREHPDRERLTVDGILALEAAGPDLLSDLDKDLAKALAALVADYLAAHSYTRHSAAEVTRAELDMALAATAYQVCGPLQTTQTSLDLLRDRAVQGELLKPDELREGLESALKSLEDAVLATDNLRLGSLELRLRPDPADLAVLVQRAVDLQKANLEMAGVQVELVAPALPATVLLDAVQAQYVLEGLIRGVWQEALRERQARSLPRGEQRPNRLLLTLEVDPSETRTLCLSLRDNGGGWPEDLLQRLYHRRMERYRPAGLADNRGLTLWEADRLAEQSGARLTVRNHPAGGAVVELFLPLLSTTDGQS